MWPHCSPNLRSWEAPGPAGSAHEWPKGCVWALNPHLRGDTGFSALPPPPPNPKPHGWLWTCAELASSLSGGCSGTKPALFHSVWGLKDKKILAHGTFSKHENSRWGTGLLHNYFITLGLLLMFAPSQNRIMGNFNVIRQLCAQVCMCWVSLWLMRRCPSRVFDFELTQPVLSTVMKHKQTTRMQVWGGPLEIIVAKPLILQMGNWSPGRWTYLEDHTACWSPRWVKNPGLQQDTVERTLAYDPANLGPYIRSATHWLAMWSQISHLTSLSFSFLIYKNVCSNLIPVFSQRVWRCFTKCSTKMIVCTYGGVCVYVYTKM